MHEVLVNRLGGLSLPRKSVVRLTDRPVMTVDVYRGRKTTIQQQQINGKNGGHLLKKRISTTMSKFFCFKSRRLFGRSKQEDTEVFLVCKNDIKNAGKPIHLNLKSPAYIDLCIY